MSFKAGAPIPEILRNSLNEVFDIRDYSAIPVQEGTVSGSDIKALLGGAKITDENMDTVYEMIARGEKKCDHLIQLYTRLKSIINSYNTKTIK